MAKVEFTRVETDEEIENINIKDGQLIYSKSGKTYMDYGNERIPTGSGGEGGSTEVYIQDTEPTEEDWKIWVDSSEQADNTYYNDNGTTTQFKATTYDTLPIGTEVDYDGETVPTGWTEVPNHADYQIQKVYDQDLTFSNFNEDVTVSSVNGTVVFYYLAEAWPRNSWGTSSTGVLVNLAINNQTSSPNQVTLVTNYKQTYGIKIYAVYIPS